MCWVGRPNFGPAASNSLTTSTTAIERMTRASTAGAPSDTFPWDLEQHGQLMNDPAYPPKDGALFALIRIANAVA